MKKLRPSSKALTGGIHVRDEGLATPDTSSTPPLVKHVRVWVHIASTPPPVTPVSAPIIDQERLLLDQEGQVCPRSARGEHQGVHLKESRRDQRLP
ncbi:hypothetical protein AMTR_s00014p00159570 [Amborella trichopoda]|uniref:Uncharacterized protein n=1 Tax=Amborella trichopoda TaxID=13333 RepID=W1PGJ3_AMBTC|nr:hypothetical protein AMTR_s00014p00159570 [Amborella trichopoda]